MTVEQHGEGDVVVRDVREDAGGGNVVAEFCGEVFLAIEEDHVARRMLAIIGDELDAGGGELRDLCVQRAELLPVHNGDELHDGASGEADADLGPEVAGERVAPVSQREAEPGGSGEASGGEIVVAQVAGRVENETQGLGC